MRAERYECYEAHMRRHMGDSAHDTGHVYRVLHAALILAKNAKNVNMDVLITAALLHDIGRAEQFRTGESHALAGARMAQEWLTEQGEDETFARWVSACIRTHRFRSDDPPATPEARILYDADKLDVSGALGVARTFMYQGHVGHPIYSVSPDGAVLSGEEKTPSFYSEYRHKLHGIAARFMTAEGKRMAQKRSEAAHRFAEHLNAEVAAGESGSAWRLLPKEASARQRRVFNIALMLAGDSEKLSRAMLAEAVMNADGAEQGQVARVIEDASALDDLGALGIAQRLMDMGAHRQGLLQLLDSEWACPEFNTTQAKGIAQVRIAAAREYLEALRGELEESRTEGERILKEILER